MFQDLIVPHLILTQRARLPTVIAPPKDSRSAVSTLARPSGVATRSAHWRRSAGVRVGVTWSITLPWSVVVTVDGRGTSGAAVAGGGGGGGIAAPGGGEHGGGVWGWGGGVPTSRRGGGGGQAPG